MNGNLKPKIYVGIKEGGSRDVFRALDKPTFETHGKYYLATIGPFRTRRGAEFMRDYGRGNPHCVCVSDAEQLARKYA